jgi:hypothetical protein
MARNDMSPDEILIAVKAVEKFGGPWSDSVKERLIERLPADLRPPESSQMRITVTIVGMPEVDDGWVTNPMLRKIESVVRKAWEPVEVTHGKRQFTVSISDDDAFEW